MKASQKFPGYYFIHLIIFLSGFTFLIYEVVWNRMLSLLLGATVSASTIVLVSFMAGFGLGAYFWGKYALTNKNTRQILSFLLFNIGILSLLNYALIKYRLPSLYGYLSVNGISAIGIEIIMFSLTSFLLMISTFFMGGILPVVSKIVIQSNDQISNGLGRIYGIETFGSALGGLATGFILLGSIGQENTLWLAVIINMALAIMLLLKKKYYNATNENSLIINSDQKLRSAEKKSEILKNNKAALFSTFIFGFVILGLQVTWIRIFKIYLTNTSYTFALISSFVILGLFMGSWLFKKYSSRIKDHKFAIFKALILLGILLGIGLFLLVNMPELIMFPFQQLLTYPAVKLLVMPMIAALSIVFPPALISGYAFPLACRMFTSDTLKISRSVGIVLTVNTIGSVVGPVLATFVFIPLLGVGVSILIFILFTISISIYLAFQLKSINHVRTYRLVLYAVSIALLATVIIKPQIRILPPSFSKVDKEILFYKETVEASLVVSKEQNNKSEVKTAYVNNAVVIGSTYDAIKAVKMIGHIPFFTGIDCKEVLVVGFGIGVTTSTIASHAEVKSIDCVELAAGLKDAAKYFSNINKNIIDDPRLHFIAGDGRHFLQRTNKKYDLISSDPTHPILGSANLYSQEYFELCKAHLTKNGMVSQYLPLHKLRPQDFQGIIKTFQSVFTEATVWLGHTHAILIGSKKPINIDFNKWEQNIASIGRDPVFYTNPYHLAACLMLDKSQISQIDPDINIDTDDQSYLEFFKASCFDDSNLNKNLAYLSANRIDLNHIFSAFDDPEQMKRFIAGSEHFIMSSIFFQEGQKKNALDELRKAVKVNPENQEYPFLIKFYFNVPK